MPVLIRAKCVLYAAAAFSIPMLAAPAAAQTAPAVEEVTITGTRVVRFGFDVPTPLSGLSLTEINAMAQTNIVDAISRLPQFANTSRPSNEATDDIAGGISNLNLRGLQPNRTLVLMDGRRLVGSTITGFYNNGGAVDINVIPNNLVARIDVVTGGASAAYGSDALSGVVNFVLDKNFAGVRGGLQGGVTTYGDDENYKADIAIGVPFAGGRGHLLLSAEHAFTAGTQGNNRPWARRSYSIMANPAYAAANGQPQYLAAFDTGLATATRGGLIVSGPLRGTMFGNGGVSSQFTFGPIVSGLLMSGGDWRTSRIDNDPSIDMRLTRQNVFGRLSYSLNNDVRLFGEVQWAESHSRPPSGVPQFRLGSDVITLDNPFIPADVVARAGHLGVTSFNLGTSNADLPAFAHDNTRTFRRFVAGLEGAVAAFGSEWYWNGYYQRSTTHISARVPGDMIYGNYTLAIDAVRSGGQIVCRSTLTNPGNGCVPYNPFGIGVNSAAAISYVTGTAYSSTILAQDVAAASISGEPLSIWAGPVSLALGIEHRRESVGGTASALDQAAAFFAGNFTASSGAFHVTEGFAEAVIPLARDTSWAKSLELNAGARGTGYSTSGYVTTWKVGGTYAPMDDVKFRLMRSHDIRAPNLGDLFNGGRSNTQTVFDPTNGVTSAIVSRVGGNPQLQPEIADAWGLGGVFTPSFLPGFMASVDYYDIRIGGAIQSLSEQQYIDQCLQGNQTLCAAIRRNSSGVIDFIAISPQNVRTQSTAGIDFEASYSLAPADIFAGIPGMLELRGSATYVLSLKTISAQGVVEGAGVNAANAGINTSGLYAPEFKYFLSARYELDRFAATLSMRGIGPGVYNNSFIACASACPAATPQNPTINNNHIEAVTYFDLALRHQVVETESGDGVEAFLTIENLFDRDPALVAGSAGYGFYGGQDNQFSYDRLGRVFRAGMRFSY